MTEYLGRDAIKEVRDTDKQTPLGNPVKEVEFYSELELIHQQIDRVRAEREALDPTNEAEIARLDKEEELLSAQQTSDKAESKLIFISELALSKGKTDYPDDEFYHKRKVAITGSILQLLAEWAVQDIEVGSIFQWLEQSLVENRDKAIGGAFGKPKHDLNLLDYHYAILDGEDRKINS